MREGRLRLEVEGGDLGIEGVEDITVTTVSVEGQEDKAQVKRGDKVRKVKKAPVPIEAYPAEEEETPLTKPTEERKIKLTKKEKKAAKLVHSSITGEVKLPETSWVTEGDDFFA